MSIWKRSRALSKEQAARAEALRVARVLLAVHQPHPNTLIEVAAWIVGEAEQPPLRAVQEGKS